MKQRKLSKEQYIDLFCQEKRMRDRRVIYVSEKVYQMLKHTAFCFKFEHYTSISSLSDAILNHHFKTNKDLLNQVSQEFKEQCLRDFNSSSLKKLEDENNDSDSAD